MIMSHCSRTQLGVLSHWARSYRPPYILQARGHNCALSSITLEGALLFRMGSAVERGRSSSVYSQLRRCVIAGRKPAPGTSWLLLSSG